MAGETIITLIGNLTADPEMRFTPSGLAVASFTIASTPRTFNRQANQWEDGEALFMRCTIWRDAAEHVAESLHKGMRIIATGRMTQRSYTDRQGIGRTVVELQVEEIGPSLRYAKADVYRADRAQTGGHTAASQGYHNPDASQAWGTPTPPGNADQPAPTAGGTTSFGDEPPF